MREFTNMISNDSIPDGEVKSTEVMKPKKGAATELITVADIGKFVFCCFTVPGMVLYDVLESSQRGKNLRYVLSSDSNPSSYSLEDYVSFTGVFGLVGAFVGVLGTVVIPATLPNALIQVAACGVAGPFAALNVLFGACFVFEGVPAAFKAAARRTVASRPYQALRAIANKPVSGQARLQGPK